MVGITRFGAYVPYYRLGVGTEAWKGRGERAIASFDEDSITMAVAAGLDCLDGADTGSIDALYFASTTSPFKEKQAATLAARAIDLRSDIFTIDFAGSTRAGTAALKAAVDAVRAGTAGKVMVVMADERVPRPRSEFDASFGDGAAAFVIGDEGVVAEVEDICSYSHEIYDVWRVDGAVFPRSAEDRFVFQEGHLKAMKRAASSLMTRMGLSPTDFSKLVVYAQTQRRHTEMCRALGFDDKSQLAPSFFGQMGDTGCAFVPMMLVAALEEAKAGERILAVSYGEGADAIALKTTDGLQGSGNGRGMKGYLAAKRILPSYLDYLRWRGLVDLAHAATRPPLKIPAVHALHREVQRNIALYGVKCLSCGTIQYPDERVCTSCQAKDNMEPAKMSKKTSLFTYSMDYLGPTLDPPLVLVVVDFEGGGRGMFSMTDRDIDEIKVGMTLEMSFRRLHTVEGIHNYYWCAVPVR
jgi:3-hydroxy-3-methylglutaryl CoA synthase